MTGSGEAMITHIFFDVGGVLGTNSWDREQRARVLTRFKIDSEDFDYRHQETVGDWEEGRMTLDEYLDITVFCRPRAFGKEEFAEAMMAESVANAPALALARALCGSGRYRLFTLNNEAAEMSAHRIEQFGLGDIFDAFLTSCWLGARKPSRRFYERALAITQANPTSSLFVDDREQNVQPARHLGMATILFRDAAQLEAELRGMGVMT